MRGKIIRGIGGFYYVVADGIVYECRAKGLFRKKKEKPLVGDDVEIERTHDSEKEYTANVVRIFERRNSLIRPEVANVDQALVFFALKMPDPDESLLDRFLVMMGKNRIPAVLCFNKTDLADDDEIRHWRELYADAGCRVLFVSAKNRTGTEELRTVLSGKTTVIAGPSGAGKSTFTNLLQSGVRMETGEISKKLGRGKNTTRRAELIEIGRDTYFCDTPGFTSLDLPAMEPEELQQYFPEFAPFEPLCRFGGCAHIHEPDCGVKQAVEEGKIHRERYDSYCRFYEELQEMKRRRY